MNQPLHAFKHTDDRLFVPVQAVTSYGLPDLYGIEGLQRLNAQAKSVGDTLRSRGTTPKDHLLFGVLLKAMAETFKKNKPAQWLSLEMQTYARPMHYRTHSAQEVVWIHGKCPGDEVDASPYAMLCEPINQDEHQYTFHDTAEAAAEHAIREANGAFPTTGYNKVYFPIFGGNPSFMDQYVQLEKALGTKLYDRVMKANNAFMTRQYTRYLEQLKAAILERATKTGFGMADLISPTTGNVVATVPELPLICWAIHGMRFLHNNITLPDYEPLSPHGMKCSMDCRHHTDWLIGGGIPLEVYRDHKHELHLAASHWAHTYQMKNFGVEHHVLSSIAQPVEGRVKHATPDNAQDIQPGDIVIIPSAGVEYQLHVERACSATGGAIITEVGHQAVHLAKVSRERQFAMLRVDDARRRYPEGMRLRIDTFSGKITLPERRR